MPHSRARSPATRFLRGPPPNAVGRRPARRRRRQLGEGAGVVLGRVAAAGVVEHVVCAARRWPGGPPFGRPWPSRERARRRRSGRSRRRTSTPASGGCRRRAGGRASRRRRRPGRGLGRGGGAGGGEHDGRGTSASAATATQVGRAQSESEWDWCGARVRPFTGAIRDGPRASPTPAHDDAPDATSRAGGGRCGRGCVRAPPRIPRRNEWSRSRPRRCSDSPHGPGTPGAAYGCGSAPDSDRSSPAWTRLQLCVPGLAGMRSRPRAVGSRQRRCPVREGRSRR